MYKIKTPNDKYSGITYGLQFNDGVGITENEEVMKVLTNDFGYILEEQKETPKSTAKKKQV